MLNVGYVLNAGRKTGDAFVGASTQNTRSARGAYYLLAKMGTIKCGPVGRQASGVEGLKLDAGRKTENAFVGASSLAKMGTIKCGQVGRQESGVGSLKRNAVGGRTQYTHFVRGACYLRAIDIVGTFMPFRVHPVSETSRSITQ